MMCKAHDELENNLPKNMKDLTLRTNKDHSSKTSSDDDLELLTIKLMKNLKQELKNKNKLTKKLPKKKEVFKAAWDESSSSEDEKQTNKDKVMNYVLMAFDNEVTKTPLF